MSDSEYEDDDEEDGAKAGYDEDDDDEEDDDKLEEEYLEYLQAFEDDDTSWQSGGSRKRKRKKLNKKDWLAMRNRVKRVKKGPGGERGSRIQDLFREYHELAQQLRNSAVGSDEAEIKARTGGKVSRAAFDDLIPVFTWLGVVEVNDEGKWVWLGEVDKNVLKAILSGQIEAEHYNAETLKKNLWPFCVDVLRVMMEYASDR